PAPTPSQTATLSQAAPPSRAPSRATSQPQGGSPHVSPYIDITRDSPTLTSVAQATGQKFFTLAFVLGSSGGGAPKSAAAIPLNDRRITGQISALRAMGGDVTVAFGGAQGPYLETSCGSASALANAYMKVIDTIKTKRLDIDIEASVNLDTMNKALAQV